MDADSRSYLERVLAAGQLGLEDSNQSTNRAIWSAVEKIAEAQGDTSTERFVGCMLAVAVEAVRDGFEQSDRDVVGTLVAQWFANAIAGQ